jgi:hypothetical protein
MQFVVASSKFEYEFEYLGIFFLGRRRHLRWLYTLFSQAELLSDDDVVNISRGYGAGHKRQENQEVTAGNWK